MLRVVSTYDPRNWEPFVERNLQTWLEHIDGELVIYHEDEQPDLKGPIWRQWEDIPGALDFRTQANQFPPAHGMFGQGDGKGYDYNYDAAKFSAKVYAQCDAAEERGDTLLWLDSDVEVKQGFGEDMIRDKLWSQPIGRFERPGFYTETGVVMWDLRQKNDFFHGYRTLYDNRRIYCLQGGWHDCWALDFVIEQLGLATTNLTKGGQDFKSPHSGGKDVIGASELGVYFRHDKGPRKYAA